VITATLTVGAVIEKVFKDNGKPTGYIAGEEGSAAVGLAAVLRGGGGEGGGAVELQGLVAKKHLRDRFRSEFRPRTAQKYAPPR